jgi:hypothetical protein
LIEEKSLTRFIHHIDPSTLVKHYLGALDELPTVASRFNGFSRSTVKPPIAATENQQTVLIATMEYEIGDWDIKIKIGGLGAMAEY